jgi:hypothetical protein
MLETDVANYRKGFAEGGYVGWTARKPRPNDTLRHVSCRGHVASAELAGWVVPVLGQGPVTAYAAGLGDVFGCDHVGQHVTGVAQSDPRPHRYVVIGRRRPGAHNGLADGVVTGRDREYPGAS